MKIPVKESFDKLPVIIHLILTSVDRTENMRQKNNPFELLIVLFYQKILLLESIASIIESNYDH